VISTNDRFADGFSEYIIHFNDFISGFLPVAILKETSKVKVTV
jgi:hypothetical protein